MDASDACDYLMNHAKLRDATKFGWPKNFKATELSCRCCGELPNLAEARNLAWVLQSLRHLCNAPITINSGYRCPEHNKKVGGRFNSTHLRCVAADIVCSKVPPDMMANMIEELIRDGRIPNGGLGRYNTFTHYDMRTTNPARWDERGK